MGALTSKFYDGAVIGARCCRAVRPLRYDCTAVVIDNITYVFDMLSSTFARAVRSSRPAIRAPVLHLRGSRAISTLPENTQIARLPLPPSTLPHPLTHASVRSQRPSRPYKASPLATPHKPPNTSTRNRYRFRPPRHPTKFHIQPAIPTTPFLHLGRARRPRPNGARPSRRLRIPRWFQPVAPERWRRRREPPGRSWGRPHGRLDPCVGYAESA
jgi:hypothetical protein